MTILDKLSTSLGRTDEAPDIALAEEVVKKKDVKAITELITLLDYKDKNIQSDCIKVLYEIGERNPELISEYTNVFLMLLDHKNNRLIWGAMSALESISSSRPKEISKHLSKILDAAAKGSVITRDHAVNILINLAKVRRYAKNAQTLLFAEMSSYPLNQLPMYAERAASIVTKEMKPKFKEVLEMRIEDVEQESKRRRIERC